MIFDIPVGDETAFSRIESYHQAHYYEQLTECVACLYNQNFKDIEIKVWSEQLRQLYALNENFLDDIVTKMQSSNESKAGAVETAVSGTAHWIGKIVNFTQNILPFDIGHWFVTEPIFDSVKFISQVTEVVFSHTIHQSIKNLLFNQFKQDTHHIDAETLSKVSQSLEADHPLSQKIIDETSILSKKLLKLFMFREMLLQGKITKDTKEQDIRTHFLKHSELEHAKNEKIVAIVEIYFIQQLNYLFENSFKSLYDFQQHLIDEEQNDFDRWLNHLFETTESRQIFSRQIQVKFLQATRDFFLQIQNEKSFLGNHPYIISFAIGLSVALLAISIVSLVLPGLSTLAVVSTGISAFALTFTSAILLINKISRIFYARSPKQREQIQNEVDIFNQNITHLYHAIENTKQTAEKELDWLEQFQTINAMLFNHKDILLGFHEAWVREYAARYRHAKVISTDLKSKIYHIVEQSHAQSEYLINAFLDGKKKRWLSYLSDTKQFLNHSANQTAIDAYELRLKLREQVLHIVSKIPYVPPDLSKFYTETLHGQLSDLSYIQHYHQWDTNPYKRLCLSAQRLYHNKEASLKETMLFKGDMDYRKLLKLPNLSDKTKIRPCEISTYLRNSLHFLLSLGQPIKPGLALDPLKLPIVPSDEYILYRMIWFRQLAKLYFQDSSIDDQSIRMYIESFVKRYFDISTKEVFDDLLNQSYYVPINSQYPTVDVNNQSYVTDQLDYIVQSLTLDLACHTKPLTPEHILKCYSQDYQEVIERKQPINLIALNLNQNDLLVQQSKVFEKYIVNLIQDTQGYIQYLHNNGVPKSYINCYQVNVLEQLIALQIDIIITTNRAGINSEEYSLINLWQYIDNYVRKQPYQINPNSGVHRLLNLFRQSPNAIYPFTLPRKQMKEYKEEIRGLLLTEQQKPLYTSIWSTPTTETKMTFEPVMSKNL